METHIIRKMELCVYVRICLALISSEQHEALKFEYMYAGKIFELHLKIRRTQIRFCLFIRIYTICICSIMLGSLYLVCTSSQSFNSLYIYKRTHGWVASVNYVFTAHLCVDNLLTYNKMPPYSTYTCVLYITKCIPDTVI